MRIFLFIVGAICLSLLSSCGQDDTVENAITFVKTSPRAASKPYRDKLDKAGTVLVKSWTTELWYRPAMLKALRATMSDTELTSAAKKRADEHRLSELFNLLLEGRDQREKKVELLLSFYPHIQNWGGWGMSSGAISIPVAASDLVSDEKIASTFFDSINSWPEGVAYPSKALERIPFDPTSANALQGTISDEWEKIKNDKTVVLETREIISRNSVERTKYYCSTHCPCTAQRLNDAIRSNFGGTHTFQLKVTTTEGGTRLGTYHIVLFVEMSQGYWGVVDPMLTREGKIQSFADWIKADLGGIGKPDSLVFHSWR